MLGGGAGHLFPSIYVDRQIDRQADRQHTSRSLSNATDPHQVAFER